MDPPDVVKTNPCSKLLCWFDPSNMEPTKATETIGARLLEQYRRWQPKIKCKQALDPTFDEVRRMCASLRRRAKDEPVLFHFNGLGVPRPTNNGELWVFNRNYTQYLPFSVYDLQTWINGPSVFVYDCNSAGTVVHNFLAFAEQRRRDTAKATSTTVDNSAEAATRGSLPNPTPAVDFVNQCIQLAACGPGEMLPTVPELPADLFTSCLTTPIKTSLQWAYGSGRKHLLIKLLPEMIEHTPGQLNDRRTMLGQLNWIFTAITDTIAWNVLPRELFHKLFRNDLLVAALFRNFLLASRILRSYGCTPISHPVLPKTYDHPLWQAWDMASDMCLTQLPGILAGTETFKSIPFFSDQLTAFEVWLSMQAGSKAEDSPEQLPIVLQVLLSQQHRLRALQLLERFLSLGPWAVRKALSVGIFPYVFKLLGSPAQELRPVLISLWAKILAEDPKCKIDLLKSAANQVRSNRGSTWKAFMYFVVIIADAHSEPQLQAMSAFVLSVFAEDHPKGQDACVEAGFIERAIPQLQCEHVELRIWLSLALGRTWSLHAIARAKALECNAIEALTNLLVDPVPKVRAVAVFALAQLLPCANSEDGGTGTSTTYIMGVSSLSEEDRRIYMVEIGIVLLSCVDDGSHAVRAELANALATLVALFREDFSKAAKRPSGHQEDSKNDPKIAETQKKILRTLLFLASDPVQLVNIPAMRSLRSIGVKPVHVKPVANEEVRGSLSSPNIGSRPMTVNQNIARVKSGHWEPGAGGTLDGTPASGSVSTGSYILQEHHAKEEEQNSLQQSIEELTDAIAAVVHASETSSYDDAATMSTKIAGLNRRIKDAAAASQFVTQELSRAGWRAADFVNADLEQLKDLRANLREVTTPIGKVTGSTGFATWYCEALHSWNRPGEYAFASDESDIKDWRLERYCSVRSMALENAQLDKNRQGSTAKLKLNDTIFHTPTKEVADAVIFHPTEPLLALANRTSSNLFIWNTEELKETCSWNNRNRQESDITSMKLINEQNEPLLAVGSSDGFVRLWANFTGSEPSPRLVTGWRAVTKLKEMQGRRAGLVLDWSQSLGKMYASGDVEYIQIWDAATESRFQKIPTRISSCVTSMCVNTGDSGLLSVGFGNGNVCLFDPRVDPDQALVQKYEQHKSWIVNVNLQRVSQNHVISGSRGGDILWWDPRFPGQAVRNLIAFKLKKGDSMTAMEVHDYASVLAAATPQQFIKIFNLDGELLNHQKYYTNFLGEPIGANSCLGFHPFLPRLATGSHEKIVSIYAPGR